MLDKLGCDKLKTLEYNESYKHKYLEIKEKNSLDLYLGYCGMEKCLPSHSYGPAVRNNYLIHYIIDGEGTYYVNGQSYRLRKNQGFLICPNTLTYYKASKDNPWTYMWISFNGIKAKKYLHYSNLNENNLIFEYTEDDSLEVYINRMLELNKMSYSNELEIQGLLYLFLSKLAITKDKRSLKKNNNMSDFYVEKAVEFIQHNYLNPSLKVTDVANFIGLNRSYLTHIFKKSLELSPKEFLLNYRINEASSLLKNTNLSIGTISKSVGYTDQLAFSKVFKKIKGISPKAYRDSFFK
ncbi:TPA: AraC family ligand binding domain-containing protein [Clostridium perfringens]|uniref:AraC family ligand binding domain-containing protein n=1 Tax=Clostridium perfringens TaxID=1502 RepID=UPI000F5336EB|nr:AraC family transcriptional regulator [Clostridium perfringens]EGT4138170.1 helix-turn-helix domain-containing protein [Clostridium perfringens]MDU3844871.1 AraC family transcriptional regulator [Clostridium perfringens]MDZ5129134.1 AraC family transcriptional regulator [Clostridium perfringens]